MSTTITSVTQANKGQTVQFLSKSASDDVLYTGTVEGMVSSDVASMFFDIQSYNESVIQSDSTVSSDLSALDFFLLRITNTDASSSSLIAFANEWIKGGSLAVVNQTVQYTFIVYDTPGSDPSQIVRLLIDSGYKAALVSTTS